MRQLLFLLSFLFAAQAVAAPLSPITRPKQFEKLTGTRNHILEGVALNAAPGTRTTTLTLEKKWSKVVVLIDYTFGACDNLTVTPTISMDDAVTFGEKTTRTCTSGACVVNTWVDTKDVSAASFITTVEYDVRGLSNLSLLFGGATCNGSDLIDVQAMATSGG